MMNAGYAGQAASNARVYVIFSHAPQVGKTLFGRALIEWIGLDRPCLAIDTQQQNSCVGTYFPDSAQMADMSDVHWQVQVFDQIISGTGRDYVIELSYHDYEHFFETLTMIRALDEQGVAFLSIVAFFVIPEEERSEQTLLNQFRATFPDVCLAVVRNQWRAARSRRYRPQRHASLSGRLEIVMPVLDDDVWPLVEATSFRFAETLNENAYVYDRVSQDVARNWTRTMFQQLWQCSLQVRMLDLWKLAGR